MRKPAGFTLVELLVVVALFAILVILIVGIFLSNSRFYETQTGEVRAINATREAADRLNEYTRGAIEFVSSYVYNSVNYTSGTGTVILKLPSLDAAKNVIANTYDYVIFGANPNASNRLELIVDPHPSSIRLPRVLQVSDKLTAVNFTYDNPDFAQARRVSYDMQVTEFGRSQASEQVFGSATLRNK